MKTFKLIAIQFLLGLSVAGSLMMNYLGGPQWVRSPVLSELADGFIWTDLADSRYPLSKHIQEYRPECTE